MNLLRHADDDGPDWTRWDLYRSPEKEDVLEGDKDSSLQCDISLVLKYSLFSCHRARRVYLADRVDLFGSEQLLLTRCAGLKRCLFISLRSYWRQHAWSSVWPRMQGLSSPKEEGMARPIPFQQSLKTATVRSSETNMFPMHTPEDSLHWGWPATIYL